MRYLLVLLLAGCNSMPEIPKETKVPVPVPCVEPQDIPVRPIFIDDQTLFAMDEYQRTLKVWEERIERIKYEALLEATILGCVRRS